MSARNNNFATYGSNALDLRYVENPHDAVIIEFPGNADAAIRENRTRHESKPSLVAKLAAKSTLVNNLLTGSIKGIEIGSFSRVEIIGAFGILHHHLCDISLLRHLAFQASHAFMRMRRSLSNALSLRVTLNIILEKERYALSFLRIS